MAQKNESTKIDWYRNGWGALAAILLFPCSLVWYAWTKSKWSQGMKVTVTAITAIIMIYSINSIITPETSPQPGMVNEFKSGTQVEAKTIEGLGVIRSKYSNYKGHRSINIKNLNGDYEYWFYIPCSSDMLSDGIEIQITPIQYSGKDYLKGDKVRCPNETGMSTSLSYSQSNDPAIGGEDALKSYKIELLWKGNVIYTGTGELQK